MIIIITNSSSDEKDNDRGNVNINNNEEERDETDSVVIDNDFDDELQQLFNEPPNDICFIIGYSALDMKSKQEAHEIEKLSDPRY